MNIDMNSSGTTYARRTYRMRSFVFMSVTMNGISAVPMAVTVPAINVDTGVPADDVSRVGRCSFGMDSHNASNDDAKLSLSVVQCDCGV